MPISVRLLERNVLQLGPPALEVAVRIVERMAGTGEYLEAVLITLGLLYLKETIDANGNVGPPRLRQWMTLVMRWPNGEPQERKFGRWWFPC